MTFSVLLQKLLEIRNEYPLLFSHTEVTQMR